MIPPLPLGGGGAGGEGFTPDPRLAPTDPNQLGQKVRSLTCAIRLRVSSTFRLTKVPRGDSLAWWSGQGQSVANHGPLPRGANQNRVVPPRGKSRELQKMKNSGNEAKKYLKTKEEP
jgi:hypothetical protein